MFSFLRSRPTVSAYPIQGYDQKVIEHDVRVFLSSAKQIADDILGPMGFAERGHIHACECVGRVKTRHFWMWWPMTPIYVDPYPYSYRGRGGYSQQGSEQTLRFVIGIAAAVLGGYAIFKMGEGINRRREASEELRDNWEFKSKFRVISHLFPTFPHLDDIKQIAEIKQRIFSRIKADASCHMALMVSLAVASTLALIGAVAASGGLMLAGTSIGVAAGVVLLCKSFDGSARRQIQDARLIRRHLTALTL